MGTFVGPDTVHLLGSRLSSLQYVCFTPFCTCREFLLQCTSYFYLAPITQYCCRKGLFGMYFFLLRRPVFPLITAVFLEPISDWKSMSHLKDDCSSLPFSLSHDDSQMYLTARIGSSMPALSGSKGRSCSGSWSWKDAGANPGETEGILV